MGEQALERALLDEAALIRGMMGKKISARVKQEHRCTGTMFLTVFQKW